MRDKFKQMKVITKLKETYQKVPIHIKASFWFLFCSFFQKGIAVITTPIFTRIMSTAEYGQYNVFSSWLSIITVFISLNLYAGVYTQGLIKFDGDKKAFSASLQGLTLVLMIIWTIIYFIFYEFWNNYFSLNTIQMLAMLSTIWTSSIFCFWSTEQRVNLDYKKLIVVTFVMTVVRPVVSVVAVLFYEDKVNNS